VYGNLSYAKNHRDGATIVIDGRQHLQEDTVIFNSIPKQTSSANLKLLQHFKGWIIETDNPVFNSTEATFMDFRVHQVHGTTFAYILPFSTTKALVEYTLFTKNVLKEEQYDEELRNYIGQVLDISDYKILETETGIIPMTDEPFYFYDDGAYQIGTAGGQTKASSGYTFQFIQKQSQKITDCLISNKSLSEIRGMPKRFRFYDNTLLHILYHNTLPGKKIFTRLFQNNIPQDVLKFMDNETNTKEELKIISSLPPWPFLKAAIKQI